MSGRRLGSTAACAVALLLAACVAAPLQGPVPIAPAATRGGGRSAGFAEIQRMAFAPLDLRFPRVGREVERRVLSNGLVLYLYPDRRLPLVEATALMRGGIAYEGDDGWTAMVLLGSELRAGGIAAMPPAALDETLERLAASIETGAGSEAIMASLNVLAGDVDRGLDLLGQVLRQPAFDEGRLRLAQARLLEDLRRRDEEPGRLAGRVFSRILYTERHPEGRELEPDRVRAVTRAQLQALHARYLHPERTLLAVAGDFDPAEMAAKVERALGDWAPGAHPLPPLPRADRQFRPGVFLVPRPLTQATVLMGHLGIDRTNPDRYAIDLMDIILGRSGFTSRVTERVRSDEGLAYSAGTFFATGTRDLGTFRASLQTKNETVARAIAAVREEVRKIAEAPVAAEELATAQEALAHSFVFRSQSPIQVATQLMTLEFDGQPPDFYETLLARYRAVTPADLQRVARQYLAPDQLTIVVVGDPARFDRPLETFGPVTRLTPSGRPVS